MFLKQKLASLISPYIDLSPSDIEALLENPKDRKFGDLAFPCFRMSKTLKKAPPVIAQDLEKEISQKIQNSPFIDKVIATGAYLNFKFKTPFLDDFLDQQIKEKKLFKPQVQNKKKILIEYSQPNTHKAFHIGHTRNVALGDSICRLIKARGDEPLATNYIGDEGTHIAKFLWYYLNHFKGTLDENNKGESLGLLYVQASQILDLSYYTSFPHTHIMSAQISDIKDHKKWKLLTLDIGLEESKTVISGLKDIEKGDLVAYASMESQVKGRRVGIIDKDGVKSEGMILSELEAEQGISHDITFKLPPSTKLGVSLAQLFCHKKYEGQDILSLYEKNKEDVSEILKKLENKDPKLTKIWETTKAWCLDEFHEIYNWLDVHFDHYFYESDMTQLGKDLVEKAYKEGILKKDEGSIGIKIDPLPFFLLLKSDGNSLYSTKDIALADIKFKDFPSDEYLYIVDKDQSLHFDQVFKTLEALGYKDAPKCRHLAYGKVEGPDGKMSSRKGNTIYFSELKRNLMETIKTEYLKKHEDNWADKKIEDTAHKISVATIKYGMLNQDQNKNITFNTKEWLSLSGNTGPYLLYTYARIQSILKKSQNSSFAEDPTPLSHEKEHFLLHQISLYPEVFEKSTLKLEPQTLCIYLFNLAKDFNQFYAQCPVLGPTHFHAQRKQLCENTALVLKEGLFLLGISVVDEM